MVFEKEVRAYIPDGRVRWIRVRKIGERVISATPIGKNDMPIYHEPDTWREVAQRILDVQKDGK